MTSVRRASRLRVGVIISLFYFSTASADEPVPGRLSPKTSGWISSMQVYEDSEGPRVWAFATETKDRSGSGGPAPTHVHVVVIDKDGLVSSHRFKSTIELDARHVSVFRHQKSLYVIHAYYWERQIRLLKLTETGFHPIPDADASSLVAAAKRASVDMPEILDTDSEWVGSDGVHAGFLRLAERNGFVRVSEPTMALLNVTPVKSKRTGYLITPDLHHKVLSASRDDDEEPLKLIDLRGEEH